MAPTTTNAAPLEFRCADGRILHGHLWLPPATEPAGTVVIVCATGVKAGYYHRYAAFLTEHGFAAITFDYRGIGLSRSTLGQDRLIRWHDWALQDIDAVLAWALEHSSTPLLTVGHSFGGFGVGLAGHGSEVSRHLSVGGQHAYWRDYRKGHRLDFWWRWHLVMPALTIVSGHFPGARLGWLEDLPRGVALDWARSRRRFHRTGPRGARSQMRRNRMLFTAPTLAVAATDDPYATPWATARALGYFPHSRALTLELDPGLLGETRIGHFGLFHSRFRDSFWAGTVHWLREGTVGLPGAVGRPGTAAPN